MRELLGAAADRAIRYLESLDGRSVAPSKRAVAALAQIDESLPAGPSDPAAVFAMGENNILTGEVVQSISGIACVTTRVGTLTVPAQAAVGDNVTLSIRPEQLLIGGGGDGCLAIGRGRISETSFQGTHLRAHVAMETGGNNELLLRAPATEQLSVGSDVELSVRPTDLVMLKR